MTNNIYTRVKKGMVFWYDINPNQNKMLNPKVIVRNSEFTDFAEYGKRPWVVVSGDEFNSMNMYCSIVPLSAGVRCPSEFELKINLFNKEATAICSQIRFVNGVELKDWMIMLNPDIMEKIDEKIAKYLDIKQSVNNMTIPNSVVVDKNSWIYNSKEFLLSKVYMKNQLNKLLKPGSIDSEFIPISTLIKRVSFGLSDNSVCLFLLTHMFSKLLEENMDPRHIQYDEENNILGISKFEWADESCVPDNTNKLTKTESERKFIKIYPKTHKRRHWNAALSYQVLNDYATLTRHGFMAKYELTDKFQMYNMRISATKYLKKHPNSQIGEIK